MAKTGIEVRIQGNVREQTNRLVRAFGQTLGWSGIRKLEQFATVNAARALQPDVKSAAPDGDSGKLAKAVVARRSRLTKPGAIVGPKQGKSGAFYARFVVYGTRAHAIPKADRTAYLFFSGAVRSRVKHPGARADNFVTQTAERQIDKAERAYTATVQALLEDAALRERVLGFEVRYRSGYNRAWINQGKRTPSA
jgi:hypothetical protein